MIDTSEGKPITFRIDKTDLPAGVSRLILFDAQGDILGDRLLFIHQTDELTIAEKADKASYNPLEPVNLQFVITDPDTIPVETTFSVSVRDKQNDVKPGQDIQSNLLLMSEIQGYVHNPDYYFESNDSIHRRALDQLLMVQGWHRFNWNWVSGKKTFVLKHQPEKGIEINGQVVSFVRSIPKPNMNVSALISQKNDSTNLHNSFIESFVTDSLGRFSISADVQGRWDMVFSVRKKRKKTDYRTVLDKLFSPQPKQYRYTNLFEELPAVSEEEKPTAIDTLLLASKDSTPIAIPKIKTKSTTRERIEDKMHYLKEVEVKAKKRSKEKDIYENRAKSLAYYDVYSEQDKVLDEGGVTEDFLGDFLVKKNRNFHWVYAGSVRVLMYKAKLPLLVVGYKMTTAMESDRIPNDLKAECIKSMYISENERSILEYLILPPNKSPEDALERYGCVAFIEAFPDGGIPVQPGRGVRKTWLDGYSQVQEFYSPNYSILPPEADYRRTLYWNPSVKTDKNGKASIQFYNNSSCKSFSISAETITPQGVIGVLKK